MKKKGGNKRKPFKLTIKKRSVGGAPMYDIINQYGRPATRPFLNKAAAQRYVNSTMKARKKK